MQEDVIIYILNIYHYIFILKILKTLRKLKIIKNI